MSWMLIILVAWAAVAAPLALVIGRTIRLRDVRADLPAHLVAPDFVPAEWTAPTTGSR